MAKLQPEDTEGTCGARWGEGGAQGPPFKKFPLVFKIALPFLIFHYLFKVRYNI